MTFLEAAIEILRRADGSMHFAEIAKRAVSENLLSHVGRDPEQAMRSCLTSAVRSGRNGEAPLIVREKPGHYALTPGAELPPPALKPVEEARPKTETESRGSKKKAKSSSKRGRKTGEPRPAPEPEPESKSESESDPEAQTPPGVESGPATSEPAPNLEFEAPSGSGLEGVTDVAVVMANAMSRLVEERPELRDELEAMQQDSTAKPEPDLEPEPEREPRSSKSSRTVRAGRGSRQEITVEERPSRRRRRRRRRGKRVEWSSGASESTTRAEDVTGKLLDGVADVLTEAGARSLHVRQIAETLAGRGVLGGEISEIERAVTSAILVDIQSKGRGSRFVARGDARYQTHGTRLPQTAAKAEEVARASVETLDRETQVQLVSWLQSLGARALESVVRIYLQQEGFNLVAALPPGRGLGRLVVEDGEGEEEEGRTLVLVIPKKTPLDPKLWDGELERNTCQQILAIAMGEAGDDASLSDTRVVGATELANWLVHRGIGVQKITFEASVLDPTFVESIGGLDT